MVPPKFEDLRGWKIFQAPNLERSLVPPLIRLTLLLHINIVLLSIVNKCSTFFTTLPFSAKGLVRVAPLVLELNP